MNIKGQQIQHGRNMEYTYLTFLSAPLEIENSALCNRKNSDRRDVSEWTSIPGNCQRGDSLVFTALIAIILPIKLKSFKNERSGKQKP